MQKIILIFSIFISFTSVATTEDILDPTNIVISPDISNSYRVKLRSFKASTPTRYSLEAITAVDELDCQGKGLRMYTGATSTYHSCYKITY